MRPTRRISTYMPFYPKYWSYFAGTTCSVDATLIKRPAEIALVFRTMTPRRVRSARSAAPTIGKLPFASRDVGIIAKTPRQNQARRNEITARTKLQQLKRRQDGISTEAVGRAAQAGASVVLPQSVADCREIKAAWRICRGEVVWGS